MDWFERVVFDGKFLRVRTRDYAAVRLEKKQHRSDVQLSERLRSLGIMGDPIEDPLKPPVQSQHYRIEGFEGDP